MCESLLSLKSQIWYSEACLGAMKAYKLKSFNSDDFGKNLFGRLKVLSLFRSFNSGGLLTPFNDGDMSFVEAVERYLTFPVVVRMSSSWIFQIRAYVLASRYEDPRFLSLSGEGGRVVENIKAVPVSYLLKDIHKYLHVLLDGIWLMSLLWQRKPYSILIRSLKSKRSGSRACDKIRFWTKLGVPSASAAWSL